MVEGFLISPPVFRKEQVIISIEVKGVVKMIEYTSALKILQDGTVIPASPLALNSQRQFDERRQRSLARYYLHAGAGGIAVGVHTTQFEIRDPRHNLLKPVLQTVMDEMKTFEQQSNKSIVKVAGACGQTSQALKEATLAKDLGYDAVLLSPGGLNDLTEDQMIKRTESVAHIIPVIGFYLQPSVGGRVFTYDYWKEICEIPGVVAIKAAPFNRYMTLDVVRAAATSSRSKEIALYTGNDDNIIVDLLTKYRFEINGKTFEKQFVGGLLGHWSVWTKTTVELFNKIKEVSKKGQIPSKLLTLAAEVTDANGAFFDVANQFKGCIAGIHEVLKRQGLLEGIWCLDPEETLSPGQEEEIDRVYDMYPYLNDDEFVAQNLSKWLI